MLKQLRSRIKASTIAAIAAIGLIVAAYSSAACFMLVIHQKECPKSLIKVD